MLLEGGLKLENDKVKTIFVLWLNFRKDKRGRDVEIFFVPSNASSLSQRALLSYSKRNSRSEERANERKQRCETRDAEAVSRDAKLRGQKLKQQKRQKQDAAAK